MSLLYTIGHSNHTPEHLLGLLRTNGIQVLVDVRSFPYSKRCPHFHGPVLQAFLRANALGYVFLGQELGGRPTEAEFYDAEGYVLYGEIAKTKAFNDGLDRLVEGMRKFDRVAVLCSEEDPTFCHRRRLVVRALMSRGVDAIHIRGDGRRQSESDLASLERMQGDGQEDLFDQPEVKEETWRSAHPIR